MKKSSCFLYVVVLTGVCYIQFLRAPEGGSFFDFIRPKAKSRPDDGNNRTDQGDHRLGYTIEQRHPDAGSPAKAPVGKTSTGGNKGGGNKNGGSGFTSIAGEKPDDSSRDGNGRPENPNGKRGGFSPKQSELPKEQLKFEKEKSIEFVKDKLIEALKKPKALGPDFATELSEFKGLKGYKDINEKMEKFDTDAEHKTITLKNVDDEVAKAVAKIKEMASKLPGEYYTKEADTFINKLSPIDKQTAEAKRLAISERLVKENKGKRITLKQAKDAVEELKTEVNKVIIDNSDLSDTQKTIVTALAKAIPDSDPKNLIVAMKNIENECVEKMTGSKSSVVSDTSLNEEGFINALNSMKESLRLRSESGDKKSLQYAIDKDQLKITNALLNPGTKQVLGEFFTKDVEPKVRKLKETYRSAKKRK